MRITYAVFITSVRTVSTAFTVHGSSAKLTQVITLLLVGAALGPPALNSEYKTGDGQTYICRY